MKYMVTYDLMESMRVTNQWLGASAKAMFSYPAFGLTTNPLAQLTAAWGEVTERSFARMVAKPDWNIASVVGEDGRDHLVNIETEIERPFGDLLHFAVQGREELPLRLEEGYRGVEEGEAREREERRAAAMGGKGRV